MEAIANPKTQLRRTCRLGFMLTMSIVAVQFKSKHPNLGESDELLVTEESSWRQSSRHLQLDRLKMMQENNALTTCHNLDIY